jgi:hypothetical protein
LLAAAVALGALGCDSRYVLGCFPGSASISSSDAGTPSPLIVTGGYDHYGIDFGPVALGQERTGAFLLLNAGCGPLQITFVQPPDDAQFGALPLTVGEVVHSDTPITVAVSFRPSDAGMRNTLILFETDSPYTGAVYLELIGTGTTP